MHRFPGDLAYVSRGAMLRSAAGDSEWWSDAISPCTVIATSCRVEEDDCDVAPDRLVLLHDGRLCFICDKYLMRQDELTDPSRLFPSYRLHEG